MATFEPRLRYRWIVASLVFFAFAIDSILHKTEKLPVASKWNTKGKETHENKQNE